MYFISMPRNLILCLANFFGAKFNKIIQKVTKKFPKTSKVHKSCQILNCLVLAHFWFFLLKINFHFRISMLGSIFPLLVFGFDITGASIVRKASTYNDSNEITAGVNKRSVLFWFVIIKEIKHIKRIKIHERTVRNLRLFCLF